MEWTELLNGMVKSVGVVGLRKAEKEMARLVKEAEEPWKKAVIEMLAEAIGKYGMEGISKVQQVVDDIADGKNPDMRFANLKARSDFLAVLQNMEADEKSRVRDFFSTIAESLAIILKTVIAGLVSA